MMDYYKHIFSQLFQSKYKNRIENKIIELEKKHSNLIYLYSSLKYTNTSDHVKHICKKVRIEEDIKLLKSLL